MKEVIQGAVETLRDGRPCVLATVVRTKGSTPQKAGAMLLVKDDGSGLGTLGGGCVEGDIWFAAKEMLRDGSGPEFKDYYLNEDIAARDGLVCGGTMYFYLEPLRKLEDFLPLGDEILEAYDGGEPVSLATVVNSRATPIAWEPNCCSAPMGWCPALLALRFWTSLLWKLPAGLRRSATPSPSRRRTEPRSSSKGSPRPLRW